MTNKPMLSVELRAFLEGVVKLCAVHGPTYNELRALLDNPSECRCKRYGKDNPHWPCPVHAEPAAQHQGEPVAIDDNVEFEKWWMSTPILRKQKIQIAQESWFARAKLAEQPEPAADHTQCEECKGWGYHENHHEGGGTECGECGGSGNSPAAEVMVMPDRMEVEPFTTIDRGSKNYKAGYNACLDKVARLNRVKP